MSLECSSIEVKETLCPKAIAKSLNSLPLEECRKLTSSSIGKTADMISRSSLVPDDAYDANDNGDNQQAENKNGPLTDKNMSIIELEERTRERRAELSKEFYSGYPYVSYHLAYCYYLDQVGALDAIRLKKSEKYNGDDNAKIVVLAGKKRLNDVEIKDELCIITIDNIESSKSSAEPGFSKKINLDLNRK